MDKISVSINQIQRSERWLWTVDSERGHAWGTSSDHDQAIADSIEYLGTLIGSKEDKQAPTNMLGITDDYFKCGEIL